MHAGAVENLDLRPRKTLVHQGQLPGRGRVIDAQFEIAEALRLLGRRHDLRREGRRLKQHALRGIVRRLGAILELRVSLLVAWVAFDLHGCGGHVLGTRETTQGHHSLSVRRHHRREHAGSAHVFGKQRRLGRKELVEAGGLVALPVVEIIEPVQPGSFDRNLCTGTRTAQLRRTMSMWQRSSALPSPDAGAADRSPGLVGRQPRGHSSHRSVDRDDVGNRLHRRGIIFHEWPSVNQRFVLPARTGNDNGDETSDLRSGTRNYLNQGAGFRV